MIKRARKGFTLLELIVVIVILGILAAIAIPTFLTLINKSQYTSAEQTASALDHDALGLAAFSPGTPISAANVSTAAGDLTGFTYKGTAGDPTAQPTASADNSTVWLSTITSGSAAGSFNITSASGYTVCYTPSTSPSTGASIGGTAGAAGTIVDGTCTGVVS